MHRLVRPLMFTALASCGAAAFAATADQAPQGRLPGWAIPQSYQIAFKVDPAQADFSGTTTIKVKLTRASDHLWLDGMELKVSKVDITDAAGRQRAGKYVVADPKAGVARVDFGGTLKPQELTLKFEYTAPLNAQLQGLCKVSAKGQPYAMTQMEPISARYAFPGFDEPGFRTPFDISLTIPDNEVGVANTRQVSEAPAGKGWKTLTFARTLFAKCLPNPGKLSRSVRPYARAQRIRLTHDRRNDLDNKPARGVIDSPWQASKSFTYL